MIFNVVALALISRTKRVVSGASIVAATKEQVSSDLAGEAVILDLNSGVYYGLNEVGSLVWNTLQEPRTVNEIRDTILLQYEVEPEQCENDLMTLLQELSAQGLVEVRNEAAT